MSKNYPRGPAFNLVPGPCQGYRVEWGTPKDTKGGYRSRRDSSESQSDAGDAMRIADLEAALYRKIRAIPRSDSIEPSVQDANES